MAITTDYDLDQAIADSAKNIVAGASNYDQALDRVTDVTNSYEEFIDHSKAHALIAGCNTDAGRVFADDCFSGQYVDYDDLACCIVYGEIKSRLSLAVHNLWHETQVEG